MHNKEEKVKPEENFGNVKGEAPKDFHLSSSISVKSASFKFEKIIVWQKAMDFGERIFTVSKEFPDFEKYNLTSQIRRASDSVALNIAEGSILQSGNEFKRFLGYSIRSLAEVVTCLHKAHRRSYLKDGEFQELYLESFNLINMLISFRKKVHGSNLPSSIF